MAEFSVSGTAFLQISVNLLVILDIYSWRLPAEVVS